MCGSVVFWYEIVLQLHCDNRPNVIIVSAEALPILCVRYAR